MKKKKTNMLEQICIQFPNTKFTFPMLDASFLFPKKSTTDYDTFLPSQGKFEHKSNRMVSSSIFPPPSSIPRNFDLCDLESLVPRTWKAEKGPDGEIMLTRKQVSELSKLLIERRTEQLEAEYTKMMANFVDMHIEAMKMSNAAKLEPSFQSMYD